MKKMTQIIIPQSYTSQNNIDLKVAEVERDSGKDNNSNSLKQKEDMN